ncbi:winged helix-turn-helix domain-containing protein [Ruicaihuangia caeni]|uniref:Crosslink repair DNA glycosylase YcaQ family protein n=1 Tax=Ruicaihuangia caeni TaxID=3042517 RepID=A0AAW6TBX5_9MICO|nr:crosslink repair DNA glycosylase YcaQ family protein [Klugiella sp. YN-L-19]MDI2099505.1 crosslink repair DNA glycosylase YcaQ family protein [Klugiella sp. YN-L-19]
MTRLLATDSVSPALARRIAVAAQGFGSMPGGPVTARRLRSTIEKLGLLQLDSVNVFERSHYLPPLARLGSYDRALLDELALSPGKGHVEYVAHEAAVIPVSTWPLLRWRMERYRGEEEREWFEANRPLAHWLLDELAEKGPLRVSEIEHDANVSRGPWWGWSDVKIAMEHLFRRGEVTTAGRQRFERVYALPHQVLPREVLDLEVPAADAKRQLVERAARAYGIATASDLADYFRMRRDDTMTAIRELVDGGVLVPVAVDGWRDLAYLHAEARRPRKITAAALLSPFDPVVWFRRRAERLFDFHYRIEIYTPAHKRVHGYYTLPLLLDDRLVGRMDLKSDRKAKTLLVQSAWRESGARAEVERIVPLLDQAMRWQGLERVQFSGRGDLSAELEAAASALR